MDPEEALEVILDERLPEFHKMASELLRDQLISNLFYREMSFLPSLRSYISL